MGKFDQENMIVYLKILLKTILQVNNTNTAHFYV